jgi:hypothetical protein
MSFVTLRYSGRTGNQLFQAATAYALAKRNGAQVLYPCKNKSKYTSEPTLKLEPQYNGEQIKLTYEEPKDFTYQPIPFTPDMELIGYFQTEKHFVDYREDILKLFPQPIKVPNTVGIHVRRGDYLRHGTKHPVVTKNYLLEAMTVFVGYDYLFFSDDIEWCTENFSMISRVAFSVQDQITDLRLMAGCDHNIISNSSFSWWGAWLNPNPDKTVIAPKVWFGEGNRHLKTENIVPENWVKI